LRRDREYDKKVIVKLIMEDKGVGKSRAYAMVDEGKARRVLRFNKVQETYELI